MAKHHSKAHNDTRALSIAAHKVLQDFKQQIEEAGEELRQDYEKQMLDNQRSYWLLTLAASVQVFFEMTGNKQKTEKLCEKLNEKLRRYMEDDATVEQVVAQVEALTDIHIGLEGQESEADP